MEIPRIDSDHIITTHELGSSKQELVEGLLSEEGGREIVVTGRAGERI